MPLSGESGAGFCPARRLAMVLALACAVQACAGQDAERSSTAGAPPPAAANLPAGAIQVGEDLYQVPIGTDDDGCPMFRLHSPTRMVAQAIYYRDATGGFTMNREDAACGSPTAD